MAGCGTGTSTAVCGGNGPSCNSGPEFLYGVPAGVGLNLFPVAAIDLTTGGFSSSSILNPPPPFLGAGGAAAVGFRFLYVSVPPNFNNPAPQMFGYSLDPSTGMPTALSGSPFSLPPNASPQGVATVPSSNLLYVADAAGTIDAFTVDGTTGALTAIQGSPFSSGTSVEPVIDPSGKYLYASDVDPPGGVLGFTIGSGGTLTAMPNSPFLVPGPPGSDFLPLGIVDTGKYVYIALVTNQIAGFSIDSGTGALTPLPSSPFPAGNAPGPLALTGNFLYTVNLGDGTISGYSIDASTGALTAVPNSPFGTGGSDLAVDFSGKYLYLDEFNAIQGFNIDPTTGTLTQGVGLLQGDYNLWLTIVQFP